VSRKYVHHIGAARQLFHSTHQSRGSVAFQICVAPPPHIGLPAHQRERGRE
jgi:hypothetical protein